MKNKDNKIIIQIVITSFAIFFMFLHIYTELKIDTIFISLLVIAFLPWLSSIFESVPTPWGNASYKHEDALDEIKNLKKKIDETTSNSQEFTKEKNEISQILDNKEKEILDFRKKIQKYITENTEVGSISDYKEWLDGFKNTGGKVLDYKMQQNFRLVEKEISIPALYGSLAYNFIVKNNGKVILTEGDPGHCGIYYLKNFAYEGKMSPGSI